MEWTRAIGVGALLLPWLDSEQSLVAAKPERAVAVSEGDSQFPRQKTVVGRKAADSAGSRIEAVDAAAAGSVDAPGEIFGQGENGDSRETARLCVGVEYRVGFRGIVDPQQAASPRSDPQPPLAVHEQGAHTLSGCARRRGELLEVSVAKAHQAAI